jgi:uncharacterized OB-fold protein
VDRSPADVYAEFCARGELAYQVDMDGRAIFRPRVGFGTWQVSAGLGTIYATTVMHRGDEPPESLVLVDLDEGFRMMSRVVGRAPEDVEVGLRVRVTFEDGVPCFAVEGEGAA